MGKVFCIFRVLVSAYCLWCFSIILQVVGGSWENDAWHHAHTHTHIYIYAQSLQWCSTLCNPMDCSLPGSSAHGILQARILEWVVIPSSRGSSQPRDQTHIFYISCIGRQVLYHYSHLGSPNSVIYEVNTCEDGYHYLHNTGHPPHHPWTSDVS